MAVANNWLSTLILAFSRRSGRGLSDGCRDARGRIARSWSCGRDRLDLDRRGLELRCTRLRIGGMNRQYVGLDLVREMQRHEGQAAIETRIDARAQLDGAASR